MERNCVTVTLCIAKVVAAALQSGCVGEPYSESGSGGGAVGTAGARRSRHHAATQPPPAPPHQLLAT